jgi:hypothetical protein
MSLAACIPELLAQGKIRKADAEKANRAYKRHYEALRGSMGDEAAAAEATTRALAELDYAAKLRKRQAGLTILAQQRGDARMAADVAKGIGPHRSLTRMLRRITDARDTIEHQAHDALFDFMQRHRRNLLGQPKDKTGLLDVVDELHGKDSGNATASGFAKAVGDAFERLRLRFNRAGGDIGRRADFGLPHRWDPLKVRQATPEQFRADLLRELAPEKMVDPLSGGAFTPERLDEFIGAAWANIKSNGLSEISDSGGLASRALANRRSDPRFFVFKDGRAWQRIADKYGDGNAYEAIMSHVHGMARDIAFMEEMGPNPAATWKRAMVRANQTAEASGTVHAGVINGSSAAQYHADRVWRMMNGDLTVPVLAEGDTLLPRFKRGAVSTIHGTRDLLTSALLGTAQLTSVVDLSTNIAARKFNGVVEHDPRLDALFGYLRQLNPFDAGHRRDAVYLGAGARDAARSMSGLARWFGENSGPRVTQVLADDVLRVTGMNKFFEAGRGAFIQDFLRQLGRERGLGFDQVKDERRAFFDRHDLTAEDWDAIRSAEPHRFRGTASVDWHAIAEKHPKAADKLMGAILREARTAVIESDPETQALTRPARPGTFWGELSGNIFQFKSFPVALIMTQGERIAEINARKGAASAAKYAMSFIASMWLMGAVSLQAKEIAKGRDMRPMDSPDFWFDALVNGGALGPIGDLVGSLKHDVVNGLGEYLGGPFVSLVEDAANTATSAFKVDPTTGERGRGFGNQVQRFARRYTPGTTIWYLRAALDRMLWDELQERIDPDYSEHQQRLQDAERRRGQGEYWERGQMLPERAPTIGQAPPQ